MDWGETQGSGTSFTAMDAGGGGFGDVAELVCEEGPPVVDRGQIAPGRLNGRRDGGLADTIPSVTEQDTMQDVTGHAAMVRWSPRRLAGTGLFVSLAGVAAYMLLIDVPWIRSSGLPTTGLIILGIGLSLSAMRRRPSAGAKILIGLNIGVLVFWHWAFFILAAVPASPRFNELKTAPDFSLVDENGSTVSLVAARAEGPVLLVFYRGFW